MMTRGLWGQRFKREGPSVSERAGPGLGLPVPLQGPYQEALDKPINLYERDEHVAHKTR